MALGRLISQLDRTPGEFVKDFPHVIFGLILIVMGVLWLILGLKGNSVVYGLLIGGCLLCLVGLYIPINKKD